MAKQARPVVLAIIDGLGLSPNMEGNAWKQANTPVLDDLMAHYPNTVLNAAGEAVGLPAGQMGNSEVGHLNIGAGKVVYTGLSLIANSLEEGTFSQNAAFKKSIDHVKAHGSRLHVMGLLSPGGVHSQEVHLYAILDMLHDAGLQNVSVHVFTDGRDVAPESVLPSLEALIKKLKGYEFDLASIQGRLYAMDRDKAFNKTELAYEALRGEADKHFTDVEAYVQSCYDNGLSDEFIPPAVLTTDKPVFLRDHDAVIFFNFRPDRARQLAHLIVGSKLYPEKPKHPVTDVQLTAMMKYEGIEKADIAFDAMEVPMPLGLVLSDNGLTQLRIAETQKYAHVTFFFDGGVDQIYPGEERILVPSLKVDNFAAYPEMSAKAITNALLPELKRFDFVVMNYANPDMVGHTGDLAAAIKAVEVIDREIGRLVSEVARLGGTLFITADHGNAEVMLDEEGHPATKHTINDVPLICTDKRVKLRPGALANVAPTILWYMDVPIPKAMTSKSLIE